MFLRPIFLATLLAFISRASSSFAITGPTQPGSPAQASVVMLLNERGFCTANIIAQNVLLTAAHCVHQIQSAVAYWSGTQADAMIPVTEIVIHADFRPDAPKTRERSIDLALVRLAHALPKPFKPVNIDYEASIQLGTKFIISGFGLTREKDEKTGGKLHSAQLITRAPLSKILIWAEDPNGRGVGGCTGDSGGPFLSSKGKLVGITVWSEGFGNKDCGSLTQALRIGAARDFVEATLAKWTH